jgi:hypothetical protein
VEGTQGSARRRLTQPLDIGVTGAEKRRSEFLGRSLKVRRVLGRARVHVTGANSGFVAGDDQDGHLVPRSDALLLALGTSAVPFAHHPRRARAHPHRSGARHSRGPTGRPRARRGRDRAPPAPPSAAPRSSGRGHDSYTRRAQASRAGIAGSAGGRSPARSPRSADTREARPRRTEGAGRRTTPARGEETPRRGATTWRRAMWKPRSRAPPRRAQRSWSGPWRCRPVVASPSAPIRRAPRTRSIKREEGLTGAKVTAGSRNSECPSRWT